MMIRIVHLAAAALALAACAPCPVPPAQPSPLPAPAPLEPSRVEPSDTMLVDEPVDSMRIVPTLP